MNEVKEMLWSLIRKQADALRVNNPRLTNYLRSNILDFSDFRSALAFNLDRNLSQQADKVNIHDWFSDILQDNPSIVLATENDLERLVSVNPACPDELSGFLSFRGIMAMATQRIAHHIYVSGDKSSAVLIQNWSATHWNMDIHPAAKMGKGLFIDHGIGIVIGETAIIEDDVSIWHGVTLGSTLRDAGDRHPKIKRGALICAGATILGNVVIGEGSIVAANAVVTKNFPDNVIIAGCPAKILGPVKGELKTLSSKSVENEGLL